MSIIDSSITRARFRAPHQHGAALVHPSLNEALDRFRSGSGLGRNQTNFCGIRLADLRHEARRELVAAAACYTQSYRDVAGLEADVENRPLVLSGHQPELFHPGVWFKNFVLDELGRRGGALPIHLNIDNDECVAPGIRVPTGDIAAPRIQFVPMDRQSASSIPYEERQVLDRSTFESFETSVTKSLGSLVSTPLITSTWPAAVTALQDTLNLGQLVSQSRHQLEGRWGRQTFELPLSRVCDTDPFRYFALEICRRARDFADSHNTILAEYRSENRLRSRSHPVPDLMIEEEWTEVPFWIWSTVDPRRRRLFVRNANGTLTLRGGTSGDSETTGVSPISLPVSRNEEMDDAIEVWQSFRQSGVKVRPRALMTTLYARLFLSDLFVHGIGGAKYDEMTDELSRRFFGLDPAPYITVTATFKLPVAIPPVVDDDVRKISGCLRELWYHPEKYLDEVGVSQSRETEDFLANKQRLVNLDPPRGQRKDRHQQLSAVNEKLRQRVASLRDVLLAEQAQLEDQLSTVRLLDSREFSFCLFPEEILSEGLGQLAGRA